MATTDAELIAERRSADDRRFLTAALLPSNAPRLAPALVAIRNLLLPGEWATWEAILATGLRASDLSVKTIDNMIRKAVTCGVLERRGDYERGGRGRTVDTREVRLVDWPESSAAA